MSTVSMLRKGQEAVKYMGWEKKIKVDIIDYNDGIRTISFDGLYVFESDGVFVIEKEKTEYNYPDSPDWNDVEEVCRVTEYGYALKKVLELWFKKLSNDFFERQQIMKDNCSDQSCDDDCGLHHL